ncbi:MAG: hypothetical protein P8Y69_06035 [Gammaproteobacteria bacterium]
MADWQTRKSAPNVRVVSHHPWRRGLLIGAVLTLCGMGSIGGYWLGRSTAELDRTYVTSLERLNVANQAAIERLEASLVEADLVREMDEDAARELKGSIGELKDRVASLTEEVTFYKSLMAPSTLARGLQIADFELAPTDRADQFTFHLLLTQVESRRDWVQGDATLEIQGRMSGGNSTTDDVERVLSLTEIATEGTYPLKFRFRYFQDLTGVITLPQGFSPDRIVVTAGKRGASAEKQTRTFEWTVAG